MISKFYFLVFVAFVLHFGGSNGQSRCTNPRGQEGTCIVVQSCPLLLELIQRRPLPPESLVFLRQSQCGFSGRQPLVCCPNTEDNTNLLPGKSACGQSEARRIVGGNYTERGEYPWMVLLGYQKPTGLGWHCGGVLINNRYILTAGHCVNERDIPRNWTLSRVRLGEWNTSSNPDCDNNNICSPEVIEIGIESFIPHDQYDPNSNSRLNDIALLRLSSPVTFNTYIQPICLPHIDDVVANIDLASIDLIVAGWGRNETRSSSEILMKLIVPFVSRTECAEKYAANRIEFGPSQICAGGEAGKDSCRGDSGGPLMINYASEQNANFYVIGLVSFGPRQCGLEGWPGIYTKVVDYRDWILRNLQS